MDQLRVKVKSLEKANISAGGQMLLGALQVASGTFEHGPYPHVLLPPQGLAKGEVFPKAVVPNLFGTKDWFHGRQLFH